ncbi:hypothetical protein BASA81_008374 [Batrachochytrium salamandrivorans]|nr:hypothetical protein BASA81_008374 [Batrachochytrium salamandrivorans]
MRWPGHPAPSCDPKAAEDQCCQGTHCTVDSIDPTQHVCLPDATLAEISLSAHVLANRAETELAILAKSLKEQSLEAYLSSQPQKVSPSHALSRAKKLSSSHNNTLHEYIPTLAPHAGEGLDQEDTFLHKAAKELRDADRELHNTQSPQAKRLILEQVRRDLLKLLNNIDLALSGSELHPLPGGNTTVVEHSNKTDPTPAEEEEPKQGGDFWDKYMPHIPISANGDKRPGTVGGPCGLTSYRDFGPCVSKPSRAPVKCVGATVKKPGVCQVNATEAEAMFHKTVKATNALVKDLHSASLELLLVQQSHAMVVENVQHGNGSSTLLPETELLEYTASTYIVVVVSVAIIAYCLCLRTAKRNPTYRPINDGWGAQA